MRHPRLVLALIGTVCAFLLAEGAARLHGDILCSDAPGAFFQADARYGWSFVPGASGTVASCAGSPVPRAPFAADSHGLAQPERSYEKPADTARLLLLGGNLAAGLGVRPEATLARMLEELVDPGRGARLEVINGGVGGFALDNDLLFFRSEGRRYAPDVVVVVLDAPGELIAISPTVIAAGGQRIPVKPFFTLIDGKLAAAPALVPQAPAPVESGDPVLRHLQLYRILHRLPTRTGPPMGWSDGIVPTDDEANRARDDARILARALLEALRDESAAAGARLVAVVAPQGGTMQHAIGGPTRAFLTDVTAELGIPTLDLAPAFSVAEGQGVVTYIPGTGRWSGTGHAVAASELWAFLHGHGLLPATVVPATFLGAGSTPSLRALPGALAGALRDARWSVPVQLVVYGLLAACVMWMIAPARAVEREWLLVALGLGVLAALVGVPVAGGALAFAVIFYETVERMPRAVGPVAAGLLAAGFAGATVAAHPKHVPGEDAYRTLFLALASGFALLRLLAYAVDRGRGAPRQPLRAFLLAVFYFPTFTAGPLEAPHRFAARAAAAAERAGTDVLAPLRAAPGALLRLATGALALVFALVCLNKLTPEVFATGGASVGRLRLWLWVGELTLSLTLILAGWSAIAIALGTLAGIRPVENFRAPWRATDPADFWRRWHVSFGTWLHDDVYLPLGGARGHAAANVLAVFAASALWHVWVMMQVVGFRHYRPAAWSGILLWAAGNAVAVVLAHGRRDASLAPGTVGRAARTAGTLVLVSLLWIPFFLPAWRTPAACLPIYLRLFFLR